jgi:MFS transporter, Spinster family, sphingosine-1-phosphate transporter
LEQWTILRGHIPMNDHRYRKYLLGVLTFISMFNYVDRTALGLVLEDIKSDLHLTDSQLGLLTGIAFALFYSVMGIPIARWADRGNRVAIISLTTICWSVMVAACGYARGFLQLLMIRVGVGIGEAGCLPPAHSLIADYFSRAERPRAMGIYMQGLSFSMVVGYFVAGWLNEFYGWRNMFILLGLPGLALAALAWLSLREPRRSSTRVDTAGVHAGKSMRGHAPVRSEDRIRLTDMFRTLWAIKSFRHLLYFWSVIYFFNYGILNWQPAFFVRSFGVDTGELGSWFAVVYGITAMLGMHLGGEWASKHAGGDERLQLRASAVANTVGGAVWTLVYFTQNKYLAYALMGVSNLVGAAVTGPVLATIQSLVPARMRAISIAIVFLFANLIGLGLGPWAAGLLSDALRPEFGDESLRYALLAMCPGFFWASWHLWLAGNSVTRDLLGVSDHREIPPQTELQSPVT